jgi:hypothetical protein
MNERPSLSPSMVRDSEHQTFHRKAHAVSAAAVNHSSALVPTLVPVVQKAS